MSRQEKPGNKNTKRYQVKNWSEYNKALVNRGDFTIWFDDDLIENWEHPNPGRKRGRPFTYSDAAILALLMLREFFRLPYRQTAGLGRALMKLMGVDVQIPDYTSLSKRAKKLEVPADISLPSGRSVDVVVDSTGLKVFGEGEWKVKKHGVTGRRVWRKLHLAVDPVTHQIVAQTLTESGCTDGEKAVELVDQAQPTINRFFGDGAYDQWDIHDALALRQIAPVIPPRRGSKIRQHGNKKAPPHPRDEAVRKIRQSGRKAWKEEVEYHRRSIAETAMSRIKITFGDKLKNRNMENQKTEAAIRAKLLNQFAIIGMPLSVWG